MWVAAWARTYNELVKEHGLNRPDSLTLFHTLMDEAKEKWGPLAVAVHEEAYDKIKDDKAAARRFSSRIWWTSSGGRWTPDWTLIIPRTGAVWRSQHGQRQAAGPRRR